MMCFTPGVLTSRPTCGRSCPSLLQTPTCPRWQLHSNTSVPFWTYKHPFRDWNGKLRTAGLGIPSKFIVNTLSKVSEHIVDSYMSIYTPKHIFQATVRARKLLREHTVCPSHVTLWPRERSTQQRPQSAPSPHPSRQIRRPEQQNFSGGRWC